MNDERPIEKLLRRAAKKRSDESGPPPELHPANRRTLQDEVARQFPKPTTTKQSMLWEWWALLQRRWVYGVGVFAVIWIGALAIAPLLSKSKSKELLAHNSPRYESTLSEATNNAPAALQPLAAMDGMEADGRNALGYSTAANLRPTAEPSAPAVATAALRRAEREILARGEAQAASASLADTATTSRQNQSVNRLESKTKSAWTNATTDRFYQKPPATVAQRTQPTGSGGKASKPTPAQLGLKFESSAFSQPGVAEKENPDSLNAKDIMTDANIAPAETVLNGRMDKSLLPQDSGAERQRTPLNSQAFSNVGADQAFTRKKDTLARKVAIPVLVNFKVEQAGRDLRVVDGDGSVYNGVVDEENTLYKQVVERQNQTLSNAYNNKFNFQTPKLAAAPNAQKPQEADYYFYRVEGTNRTLNQNVVFTWNFVSTNDALVAAQLNYKAVAQKLDATKLPSQFPALLQNSFINGRAQFGAGREVEVNAVPVK